MSESSSSPESLSFVQIKGRVVHVERAVADLSKDELLDITTFLFKKSDVCAYAAFEPNIASEIGVIVLCGFGERFRTLALLRQVAAPSVIVQDPEAPWFTGSPLCGGILEIKATVKQLFPNVIRWLIVGQSSGGYAALYFSRLIPNNITIAYSPQTHDDMNIKTNKIFVPPSFSLSSTTPATSPIVDLEVLFGQASPGRGSRAYIMSAYSEHQNPPTAWLWLDAMHWARLIEHPDVSLFLLDQTTHAVLFQNVARAARLIGELARCPDWKHEIAVGLISASVYGSPTETLIELPT